MRERLFNFDQNVLSTKSLGRLFYDFKNLSHKCVIMELIFHI